MQKLVCVYLRYVSMETVLNEYRTGPAWTEFGAGSYLAPLGP